MSGGGIYYLIYPGQGKTILWADVIQVSVINTNSSFSSIFSDHGHVCQPIGILNFFYKFGYQQLVFFSLNDLLSIQMEASDLLADRSRGWHNIKPK